MATNGATSGFRGQLLWQKAQDFATSVVLIVRDLPNDRAADSIGRQLVRAASSIAANIAEGYGRYSHGAYRNHLSIARGSAFESESWIDLLVRSGYIAHESGDELISRCTELQKLVSYRMKSLGSPGVRTVKEEGVAYEVE